MEVSNILTRTIITLISLAVIVFLFNFFMPLNEKWTFNNTCDQYFKILIANGELTSSEKNDLINKLSSKGLTNIRVVVVESEWGEEVTLEIKATMKVKNIEYEEDYQIEYNETSISNVLR